MIYPIKNSTLIVYYRYYDAFIAIEFFKNPQNFKDESYRDKFKISWLNIDNDLSSFPDFVVKRVYEIKETIPMYSNNLLNQNSNYYGKSQIQQNYQGGSHTPNFNKYQMGFPSPNMNGFQQYQNYSMTPNYNNYGNLNSNLLKNNNQNINSRQVTTFSSGNNNSKFIIPIEEDTSKNISGKYTCRYELQIENDKEFQVARKLIGAKGCNMKKIVESCGGSNENDVKLRLRGKGSGFKEGPNNQESDDPLHLCISSKNSEKYIQACSLVDELINGVFEEYKKFCIRTNKTAVSKLVIKKEEGLALKINQSKVLNQQKDQNVINNNVQQNLIPVVQNFISPQNIQSNQDINKTYFTTTFNHNNNMNSLNNSLNNLNLNNSNSQTNSINNINVTNGNIPKPKQIKNYISIYDDN